MSSNFNLISRDAFNNFFEKHKIPLQGRVVFPDQDTSYLLAVDALELGNAFGTFVLSALMTEHKDAIETNFDNKDSAYECYKYFTYGYSKTPGLH